MLAMLKQMRQASAVGGPEKVRADLHRFLERTGADEIIVSGATFDPALRRRSLELTAKAVA
jgi:alkanesulfonate monooxygenase SsuD/methylene tetrahydromethanopterin reductase-like flavin-dependent oxidoreductase (luciferase family)